MLTYSESIPTLNLSDKFSIEHKNGKLCIKNELKSLDSIERNKDLKGYLDFCCRVTNHTETVKNKFLYEDDFFKFINDEYSMCNDIFIKSVGFSIDKYTNLIKKILTFCKTELNNIKDFSLDNCGRIELNLMNIAKMVKAFIMPLKEFDSLEKKILDELIMDPKDIDISDTHKFLINWKPLIKYDDKIIFSPDMLLESMNYFIHLKLINDKSVQLIEHSYQKINEVYQRLCSERFVNKIIEVAEGHNYEVLYKNKDIKISKSQSIGDIDLAIKKDNFVFLIEAKNHSIPLDIYFGDYVKCIEKKKEHDNKWLNHIKEHKNYVSMNLNEFGISKEDSFDYIIVTKNPDIVTHFDNYPCLTLIEFDSYLDNSYQCNIKNFFEHFYEKITTDKSIFSIPQPSLFFGE